MNAPSPPQANEPLWGELEIPIIGLTGPKDSGKTLWASSIRPERTKLIDCELGSATYSGIPFADRVDLFEELASQGRENPSALDAFLCWKSHMDAVTKGQFDVIVTDTWDFVQVGLHDWIKSNPRMYKRSAEQYNKASGLLWADVKLWLHIYLGNLAKKCNNGSVVLICHEGTVWRDGKPVEGKMKTKGVDTVYQLASLFLNFERAPDNNGKIPEIPVCYCDNAHRGKSRLVKTEIVNGKIKHHSVLPPRIKDCTPDRIRDFIKSPVDYSKLKAHEKAPVQSMSDDDRLLIQQSISENERDAQEYQLNRFQLMQQAGAGQVPPPPEPSEQNQEFTTQDVPSQNDSTVTDSPTSDASTTEQEAQAATDAANFTKDQEASSPQEQEQQQPLPSESRAAVFNKLDQQKAAFGLNDAEWGGVLAKRLHKDGSRRPCEKTDDLTLKDAEELSVALQARIDEEKKAASKETLQEMGKS